MMEKTRMYIFRNLDPEVYAYHNEERENKKNRFNLVVFKSSDALAVEVICYTISYYHYCKLFFLVIEAFRFGFIYFFILSYICLYLSLGLVCYVQVRNDSSRLKQTLSLPIFLLFIPTVTS